jgi:hypothetical protein
MSKAGRSPITKTREAVKNANDEEKLQESSDNMPTTRAGEAG